MKLWIRLDVAIRSDPNVAELADRLNMRFAEAVGCCALLWCAIGEHRPNGDVSGIGIPALEKWASFEPRKGAPTGSFGRLFLELFATDGTASGWQDRQGKLVERAERDRLRKAEERRRKSEDNPGLSTVTERNGTEQDQKPTTTRVRARLLEADWSAFDDLLSRVPDPEIWSCELDAMLEGMAGHHKAAPAQIGRAIRDMIANGKHRQPNIRQLRRYVEGAAEKPQAATSDARRERAERLFTAFITYGFSQNLPLEAHYRRVDELAASGKITDPEHFKRELRACEPWTWLRSVKEFDREKAITRIAQAIAPIEKVAA